jgi:hypothetical protein
MVPVAAPEQFQHFTLNEIQRQFSHLQQFNATTGSGAQKARQPWQTLNSQQLGSTHYILQGPKACPE